MPDKAFEKTKIKKAKIMGVIALLLFFIAFGFLGWAAIMQDNNRAGTGAALTALIGFLGTNILSVFLLYKAYPMLILSDCIRMGEKYDKQEPVRLSLPDQSHFGQILSCQHFKNTQDGYYRKKKFSFLKDSINYVIRITEDTEIERALHREISRFENTHNKWNNLCLILFVYMDHVDEDMMTAVRNLGLDRIILETVINPRAATSVVMVAVDRETGLGCFMDAAGHNISLYAHGCRLIKKIARSADTHLKETV